MSTRIEVDSIGEKPVPKDAYYGIQTLRAVENYPVSGLRAPKVFVEAYVMVKKAAAVANMEVGWLDEKIGRAIIKACDEVLEGKLRQNEWRLKEGELEKAKKWAQEVAEAISK